MKIVGGDLTIIVPEAPLVVLSIAPLTIYFPSF